MFSYDKVDSKAIRLLLSFSSTHGKLFTMLIVNSDDRLKRRLRYSLSGAIGNKITSFKSESNNH
jgi:hypothetical protein